MTRFRDRLGGETCLVPSRLICDAWTADDQRLGDELPGIEDGSAIGRWPDDNESDAVIRLFHAVGEDAPWDVLANKPPVAQKLAERARPQPLDVEIMRHLQHLQHVCHRPRLHLRVEEERVPVSRAQRVPVRAVAELVSHPGDWEHRTLQSIQPSRVLARLIEDDWNIYENRVAVRLVDNLLAYLAKRLEELKKIDEVLKARDYGKEVRHTSFRRARRISELWADTLESKTEAELHRTMRRLELAQRDLQTLLDAPLYQRVPRRASVSLSLTPTNILVNDVHYRKVALLWRAWAKYGHKRQETHKQRAARRVREARAWDRFVLHLVVRAFAGLGWDANSMASEWILTRPGWKQVSVAVDGQGVVVLRSEGVELRLLPLYASFSGADVSALMGVVCNWDKLDGDIVAVHVGPPAKMPDVDRATGWSFGRKAVIFGCSPWGIDSEERMARLVNGWLNRGAVRPYPVFAELRALPELPHEWNWVRYDGLHLVALRAPDQGESVVAHAWAARKRRELEIQVRQAKNAKRAPAVAPGKAVEFFDRFVDSTAETLSALDACPVCGGKGRIEPRPGKAVDGSDATWWAICYGCESEWGLRGCTGCGSRFRALAVHLGLDNAQDLATKTPPQDWPDRMVGRDVWAQPCSTKEMGHFRCPECGACSGGGCERCQPGQHSR